MTLKYQTTETFIDQTNQLCTDGLTEHVLSSTHTVLFNRDRSQNHPTTLPLTTSRQYSNITPVIMASISTCSFKGSARVQRAWVKLKLTSVQREVRADRGWNMVGRCGSECDESDESLLTQQPGSYCMEHKRMESTRPQMQTLAVAADTLFTPLARLAKVALWLDRILRLRR
jgi:hypothetical protein